MVEGKIYAHYLISQRDNLRSKGEGGAQPNISKEKIVEFLFPLPPLAEQQHIVDKIEEYMSLCEQLKNGEFIGNSENLAKIISFVPHIAQEEPLLAVARGETADKKPSKQLLSAIDELFEDE